MAILSLTLAPDAVARLHDVLVCLGKFSETVSIEAGRDEMILAALNPSKSAHASFTLETAKFCNEYHFVPSQFNGQSPSDNERFTCKLYNKALLAVFKGRLADARERETAIEKCELRIQDGQGIVECRLIARIICRHGQLNPLDVQVSLIDQMVDEEIGVIKTYKLTYESVAVMHARFDKPNANNRWTIHSRVLREFIEHFGPRTEQLDVYSDNGRATFRSYTEKIMEGKEILKQPLHTSVEIDTLEFQHFEVEDRLHVVISVKDFKAIVTHADTLGESISASYSQPMRPMQLSYQGHGMICEFTLMTIGEPQGGSATPVPAPVRGQTSNSTSRQGSNLPMQRASGPTQSAMLPPSRMVSRTRAQEPARRRERRPSPPPPKASLESESLFLSDVQDDRRWDEADYENDDEDMLGWDASVDHDAMANTYGRHVRDNTGGLSRRSSEDTDDGALAGDRVAPTQRVSQIHGIFDIH
ncbi:MAG: hypothetical protein M1835_000504 [Candelina submexicana]|nr:MAG: hypothetical protein M1835_000504 [Candelina submexicana]